MKNQQEFEQTEIGRIPREWEIVKLGDREVCQIIMGQSPPSSTYNKLQKGLPFLQGNMEFGEIYPKPSIYCSEPIKIAEKNDVLISVRAPVGEVNISPSRVCIGRGLAAIRCKPNKTSDLFLFYHLKYIGKKFESISAGSTFKAIRKNDLDQLEILLPSLPEQKKIAEILSTVDQAIERVSEAIEKTQKLKKGLMQELLTKGIGHKEFKETEVGRIPKEWILEVAEKVCSRVTDGTHDTPKPSENGYYLVTSKDIKEGGINFSQTYLISEDDFNEINRRSKVDSYDVLFSMIGTVGQTAIVKDNYPKFAIKNVGLFKTNNSKVLARWLHYYFGSKFAQFYIKNSTKGTTQKYLPLFSLRGFPITVAPLPEQQKITEILSEVDKRLELLREKKGKLEKIKKGLMNDLLTGKRRVRLES